MFIPGDGPKLLTDLNKNGSNEDEKVLENTPNLKDPTKNNNQNIRIESNTRNNNKNEIITKISYIRNINIKNVFLLRFSL